MGRWIRRIGPKRFVRLWMGSTSVEEVADALGESPQKVRAAARYLRSQGVRIGRSPGKMAPRYREEMTPEEVAKLNDRIEYLAWRRRLLDRMANE